MGIALSQKRLLSLPSDLNANELLVHDCEKLYKDTYLKYYYM